MGTTLTWRSTSIPLAAEHCAIKTCSAGWFYVERLLFKALTGSKGSRLCKNTLKS